MNQKNLNSVCQTENIDLTAIQKKAFDIILSVLEDGEYNNVSLSSDFINVGIDSITYIKAIVALESEFGIEFDDELLITAFPTIKSMIEYVEAEIQ